MKYRIFISSVQREFAKERKALASYIRKDAILGKFFEVFLFEEVPAQERKADGVYLAEVDACDIYLGIFGHTYGNVDSRGVSATEREYRRAAARHKYRICFVDKSAGETNPRQAAFIGRVNDDVVRKGFVGYDDLRTHKCPSVRRRQDRRSYNQRLERSEDSRLHTHRAREAAVLSSCELVGGEVAHGT